MVAHGGTPRNVAGRSSAWPAPTTLGNLGDLDRFDADYARAESRLRQSLELLVRLEDAWGSSAALESLALVACARGAARRSAALFGAADAQREEAGAALPPVDLPEHDRAMAALRLQLGHEALQAGLARGCRLTRREALALAHQLPDGLTPVIARPPLSVQVLTEREREVAGLVAAGLSNRQIADELVFTKHTADKHVGNILGKLSLASRAQLAVWWIAHVGQPTQSSYF
jgi:ATP/maltotriose-dependent transcriptional regulator MalT